MKKIFIFAVLLCVPFMLRVCSVNRNSDSAVQTETMSNSAISGSDETAPETEGRELEKQATIVVEGVSISQPEMEEARETVSEKGWELSGEESEKEQVFMKMNIQVGAYTFTATLEDNNAVRELTEMMQAGPVTVHMSDYSGFEKVGPLGKSLTASDSQTTTTAGDIVLYNGNNIVMFYGRNSWSYTRIGKIDNLTNWEAALGGGDVTATFTLAE